MMQYLVRGQIQSFLISVLIIGVILMIVFQSVRIGLIGLIPNLFPAICVGGYMGWSGIPLDMMTACIIPMMLGMAVDDTYTSSTTPNWSMTEQITIIRLFAGHSALSGWQ